ncbi:MAG: hypothetical protein AAFW70_10025 [Cyanobacteria bacterium J06635_10]
MFNKSSDQFAEAVSSTLEQAVESTILNKELKVAFAEFMQALADKLQDEWDKRAKIEIDHENYGLEYDEVTDSYTWKKSDELGNITEEGLTSNQIQNITSKLIDSELQSSGQLDLTGSENPALRITASLKEGGDMVLYEQLDNGTITTNVVTELGKEEIIEAAWEPLSQILPEEQLSVTADELLSQVETDIVSENVVNDLLSQVESQAKKQPTSDVEREASELLNQVKSQIDLRSVVSELSNEQSTPDIQTEASELLNQIESQIELEETASDLLFQVETSAELEQPDFIVNEDGEISNNKPGKIIKREPSELVFFDEVDNSLARIKAATKEVSAANVSYTEAASSPELSDSQKSWVKEKQVPVYANTIPRKEAIKQENKQMAIAAFELVRKYGEIQEDGSVAYKSDAFTIKKVGKEYSIHQRKDELSGYANPVMSFSLDKKGKPIKVDAGKLNGAERQEFLLVADNIRDKVALPDKNSDIREMANQLGSLSPAGTQKVLTSFKNAEVMKIMADSLKESGTDELKIGNFRIKAEQNTDLTQASLQLYKVEPDGSERLAVDWEALKKESGALETNMKTMKLGENDINQLKFVAANANYLNNNQYSSTLETKVPSNSPTQTTLPLHPALKREWEKIESMPKGKGWNQVTEQGNEELRKKLKTQEGKLSVPEQREMYAKLTLQSKIQLDTTGKSDINLPPLKHITQDLRQQRQNNINETYKPTPKTNNGSRTKVQNLNKFNKKGLEI